jgi:predicted nucleotidyltransferase
MSMTNLPLAPVEREAVARFASSLYQSFPGLVQSLRLFGSKARGDARPDSDIDLLVVVKHESYQLWEAIQNLAADVSLNYDVFLSVKVMATSRYAYLRNLDVLLIRNIEQEGIELGEPGGESQTVPG